MRPHSASFIFFCPMSKMYSTPTIVNVHNFYKIVDKNLMCIIIRCSLRRMYQRMYNNLIPISIVDYQKSEDENKAIQKLAEHRDMKLMVKEIGEKHGIEILSTEGNSHMGDFSYPKKDKQKLISILDSYLKD